MAGVKGKSGRRPKIKDGTAFKQQKASEAQEALRRMQLFAKDIESKDRDIRAWFEANKYVYEAEYGRPHQSQDLRVKGIINFLPDDYELMTRPLLEEQKLLDEGKDATEQGEKQGKDETI